MAGGRVFSPIRKYQRAMQPFKMVDARMSVVRFNRWGKALHSRMQGKTSSVGEAGLALRKIVFSFLGEAIKRTPVDTGRARASWTVYHEQRGKKPPSLSDTTLIHRAAPPDLQQREIAEGKRMGDAVENLGVKEAQWITIINRVPYIVMLEYGWSRQGSGAIRISVRHARQKMSEAGLVAIRKSVVYADRVVPGRLGGGIVRA